MTKHYRTRHDTVAAVKDRLERRPDELFIVKHQRPGKPPAWSVTPTTPKPDSSWSGPIRRDNVNAFCRLWVSLSTIFDQPTTSKGTA